MLRRPRWRARRRGRSRLTAIGRPYSGRGVRESRRDSDRLPREARPQTTHPGHSACRREGLSEAAGPAAPFSVVPRSARRAAPAVEKNISIFKRKNTVYIRVHSHPVDTVTHRSATHSLSLSERKFLLCRTPGRPDATSHKGTVRSGLTVGGLSGPDPGRVPRGRRVGHLAWRGGRGRKASSAFVLVVSRGSHTVGLVRLQRPHVQHNGRRFTAFRASCPRATSACSARPRDPHAA